MGNFKRGFAGENLSGTTEIEVLKVTSTTQLGDASGDTVTVYGNVASSGNPTFDYSGSSGTFKTPTGVNTIGGAISSTSAITTTGQVTGGTLTDGTASIKSGAATGLTSVTSTTLTDGTATITGGAASGLTTINASGTATLGAVSSTGALTTTGQVTGGTLTDGTASIKSGAATGLTSVTSTTLTDGVASITAGALSGATTGIFGGDLTTSRTKATSGGTLWLVGGLPTAYQAIDKGSGTIGAGQSVAVSYTAAFGGAPKLAVSYTSNTAGGTSIWASNVSSIGGSVNGVAGATFSWIAMGDRLGP